MPTIKKLGKPKKTNDASVRRAERQAIYNTTRWHSLRDVKRMNDPLCERCLAKKPSIVRPATEIHHVVSFMSVEDMTERKALAYDYENLMSLCHECHEAMHGGRPHDD